MKRDYPKSGQLGNRMGKPGKCISEQITEFGETVQLPNGVPTSRRFTKQYNPGEPDPEGLPLPPGMLQFK